MSKASELEEQLLTIHEQRRAGGIARWEGKSEKARKLAMKKVRAGIKRRKKKRPVHN